MKTLMFVFNGLVWVLGIVLIIIGIVVLVEGNNWDDIIDNKTVPVSIMLLVVGVCIAIVGFLGCFGAMKQNTAMLLIYAVVLSVIIMVQLVAGILAFIYSDSDKVEILVQEGLDKALQTYGESKSYTNALDWAQEYFECCGMRAATDYKKSSGMATYWITTANHTMDVPDSCCKTITTGCGLNKADATSSTINNKGCFDKLENKLEDSSIMMGVCGIVFLAVELMAVILASLLRRA